MAYKLPKYHKVNLKTKLEAIDLSKNGMKISHITKRYKFRRNTLLAWKKNENNLRKEYENMCNIEVLDKSITTPHDAVKCDLIINRVENIKSLHKVPNVSLKKKIECIDLVKEFNVSYVSKKTGFSNNLINRWLKNEVNIRKISANREKEEQLKHNKLLLRQEIKELLHPASTELNSSSVIIEDREETVRVGLPMKIKVLDMFDRGISAYEIADQLGLSRSSVFYWLSIAPKLREKALLIQRCIIWDSVPPANILPETKRLKREKRLLRDKKIQMHPKHLTSLETKLLAIQWLARMKNSSFECIGNIFQYERHAIRHWSMSKEKLLSKYELRERKRDNKLNSLLTNTDHKAEIKKLYKLSKSDRALVLLDSYLTHGLKYARNGLVMPVSPGASTAGPLRISRSPSALVHQSKKHLIEERACPEMWALFEELYRDQHRVLRAIAERFAVLLDQTMVYDTSSKPVLELEIKQLRCELDESIDILVGLHHMMIR